MKILTTILLFLLVLLPVTATDPDITMYRIEMAAAPMTGYSFIHSRGQITLMMDSLWIATEHIDKHVYLVLDQWTPSGGMYTIIKLRGNRPGGRPHSLIISNPPKTAVWQTEYGYDIYFKLYWRP